MPKSWKLSKFYALSTFSAKKLEESPKILMVTGLPGLLLLEGMSIRLNSKQDSCNYVRQIPGIIWGIIPDTTICTGRSPGKVPDFLKRKGESHTIFCLCNLSHFVYANISCCLPAALRTHLVNQCLDVQTGDILCFRCKNKMKKPMTGIIFSYNPLSLVGT